MPADTAVFPFMMELNAMLLDPISSSYGEIGRFRQALWNKHFGNVHVQLDRPVDGWLEQWKRTAEANTNAS
jgi:hypothetical protein